MNRFFVAFFSLCFVFSCDYFGKKKVYSEDIIEEELKTISWNDVDQYPAFANCESLTNTSERKTCFETTLTKHVNSFFENQTIIVSEDIKDTLFLKMEIDKTGAIAARSIKADSLTRVQIPKLDSLIQVNILSLPKIYPAIKRGQQVNTEFTLPIIINIK